MAPRSLTGTPNPNASAYAPSRATHIMSRVGVPMDRDRPIAKAGLFLGYGDNKADTERANLYYYGENRLSEEMHPVDRTKAISICSKGSFEIAADIPLIKASAAAAMMLRQEDKNSGRTISQNYKQSDNWSKNMIVVLTTSTTLAFRSVNDHARGEPRGCALIAYQVVPDDACNWPGDIYAPKLVDTLNELLNQSGEDALDRLFRAKHNFVSNLMREQRHCRPTNSKYNC